jgi:hypothetical protein
MCKRIQEEELRIDRPRYIVAKLSTRSSSTIYRYLNLRLE